MHAGHAAGQHAMKCNPLMRGCPLVLAHTACKQEQTLQPVMETLLMAERAMLYTLAFDLNVEHPYSYLIKALDKLGVDSRASPHKDFLQQCVNMLNDRCMGLQGACWEGRASLPRIVAHYARLSVARQPASGPALPPLWTSCAA